MSVPALLHESLFTGFIAGGLEGSAAVIRQTLVNTVGGAPYASKTAVEYAVWPSGALGSLGAPTMKSSVATTDATGELTIDASGNFLPGDEVILMVRKAQGGAPADDDDYGSGALIVSAS